MARFIRWFAEIGLADVSSVGGKNASLGEMVRELSPLGVRVPNGFAVTAEAYRHTLERAGVAAALHDTLAGLDVANIDDLDSLGLPGCMR